MVLQAEHTEQSDMQGTFINASFLTDLGLEVEAFREARC